MCYHREIRHFAAATSDLTMASPHELIIAGARGAGQWDLAI